MTAKRFSQLDELTTLTGDEEVPLAFNGANRKFKLRTLRSLIRKQDVGLGNVDNTSDLNKPISIATQGALNSKSNINHSHPLSEVIGLQDTLANKSEHGHHHSIPEVDGLQAELDAKSNVGHGHGLTELPDVQIALNNKAGVSHAHNASDITGLNVLLADKANTVHQHHAADITDLTPAVEQIIASTGVTGGDVSVNKIEW